MHQVPPPPPNNLVRLPTPAPKGSPLPPPAPVPGRDSVPQYAMVPLDLLVRQEEAVKRMAAAMLDFEERMRRSEDSIDRLTKRLLLLVQELRAGLFPGP